MRGIIIVADIRPFGKFPPSSAASTPSLSAAAATAGAGTLAVDRVAGKSGTVGADAAASQRAGCYASGYGKTSVLRCSMYSATETLVPASNHTAPAPATSAPPRSTLRHRLPSATGYTRIVFHSVALSTDRDCSVAYVSADRCCTLGAGNDDDDDDDNDNDNDDDKSVKPPPLPRASMSSQLRQAGSAAAAAAEVPMAEAAAADAVAARTPVRRRAC